MAFIDFVEALNKSADQPRVPKGQPGGGEFASKDGSKTDAKPSVIAQDVTTDVRKLVRTHLDGSRAGMANFNQDVQGGIGRAVVVDGKPVAYGITKRSLAGDDIYEIGHVVTDPAHQGKGYGTAVMDDLEKSAKDAGAKVVLLCAGDDKASAMYEKRGYKMVNEDVGLYAKSLKD